jgi:DNA-binding NarL/FixJ family response regulator
MMLDVQLPDGSGVQVCRDVRPDDPSVKGVLLTAAGDDDALMLSVLAGASGYLVKLASTTDVVDAVRRVRAGRTLLGVAVMEGSRMTSPPAPRAWTPALRTGVVVTSEARSGTPRPYGSGDAAMALHGAGRRQVA